MNALYVQETYKLVNKILILFNYIVNMYITNIVFSNGLKIVLYALYVKMIINNIFE